MDSILLRFHVLGLCLALTGGGLSACGQKMMQTPVMFDGAQLTPFEKLDEAQRTNDIHQSSPIT